MNMKTIHIIAVCAALSASAAVYPQDDGRRTVKLSGPGWTLDGKPVSVPHSWNVEDFAKTGEIGVEEFRKTPKTSRVRQMTGVYAKTLPQKRPGRRYFVKCEGAGQKARMSVNGITVGRHCGAYNAFTFEITGAMKDKGENRLEIEVDNRFDSDIPPMSADYTPFGGLYRDVWLIETPLTCITPAKDAACGLRIKTDPVTGRVTAEIDIDGFEKWSPEEPNVYELTVTVKKGGVKDSVTKTFGFRDAQFREDGFYLNGVKRRMRGVNRHQDVGVERGWAAHDTDHERDIRIMKEMGVDAVRLSHYPQSEHFLDLCDREGLLVWSEIPLVNTMNDTEGFRTNAIVSAREMVLERMHHPSVFAWGLYNEIRPVPGRMTPQQVAQELYPPRDVMRQIDPTRPVVAASSHWVNNKPLNEITDILGFNLYPYWYERKKTMKQLVSEAMKGCPFKSVAISEYGGGGSVKHHTLPVKSNHPSERFHSEEFQTKIIVDDCRDLFADPRLWGTFHWCMFDFHSYVRNEGDTPLINDKGVVTRDRKTKKDGFYFYQANWTSTPVLRLMGARAEKLDAPVCDVMGFSNVGDTELFVNGKSLGVRSPDEIKTVTWKNVRFSPGKNRVELKAGGLVSSAVWAL